MASFDATHAAGFTLIEMLLSVAVLSLILGMSMPLYESFTTRNDLDIATQNVANSLRRAAAYCRGGNNDSQWGVEVQSGSITVFSGSSYAGRNTNFDETTSVPTNIAITGGTVEVDFAKLTGLPTSTPSITLTNATETRTVTINVKGVVDY